MVWRVLYFLQIVFVLFPTVPSAMLQHALPWVAMAVLVAVAPLVDATVTGPPTPVPGNGTLERLGTCSSDDCWDGEDFNSPCWQAGSLSPCHCSADGCCSLVKLQRT